MNGMCACGIPAEYNPFHEGHRWQIRRIRQELHPDVVIAVMSGSFVQRGEPAVLDPFVRAAAAVRSGIDLVLELPLYASIQASSGFARGAVAQLKAAQVSWISFGSECGNLENLQEIADTAINPDHLRAALKSGISYPHAYSLLTTEMEPNDILAVSYLQAMKDTGIRPFLVQRTTDYREKELTEIPSALALRTALQKKQPLPDTIMKQELEAGPLVFPQDLWPYLRTALLLSPREQLQQYFLFREGIENHLQRCARQSDTWEEFLQLAVTSRYTAGRIRRTCLSAMLQLRPEEVRQAEQEEPVLHVLAFNETGRTYLHQLRQQHAVPIASRFAAQPKHLRQLGERAAWLYSSVLCPADRRTYLQHVLGGAWYIAN